MIKQLLECQECGTESHIEYDNDNVIGTPEYCPFCGSSYIEESVNDDADLLKDDIDDMDLQW